MKKLENLSRGDLKELKEELENLYESYEVEELDSLIKCCKSQIMNKSNINLLDIIGKTLYSGKEGEYCAVKVKSFLNEEEIEDILDDDEQYTELCYEGVFFDGDYLSRITEDDYTLELYGDGSISLEGDTMSEIPESIYNQIVSCFDTAKDLLINPKEEIKFI